MSKPVITREIKALERGGPWIAIGLVGLLLIAGTLAGGLVMASSLGLPGESDLRGYTVTGIVLGCFAAVLGTLAVIYSFRKRAMQESLRGSGSMMSWLWLHVTIGSLAVVAALLHAGWGVISLQLSSGKLLIVSFLVVGLSGVVWRVRYATVPPAAAKRIGNYAQAQSAKRAEEQLTEIEKLAAGRSPVFHQLKGWLLQAPRSPHEIQAAGAQIPPAEVQAAHELVRLAGSRHRALERQKLQGQYAGRLQGLRALHIPLTLVIPALLVIHIVGALRLPERMFDVGSAPIGALSGFSRAEDCRPCHQAIYEQWATSMHAHAMKSPVMIAQNNQLVRAELGRLGPDPGEICVNCHGPVGAALTTGAILPLTRPLYSTDHLNEGVGCTSCHQYTGGSVAGQGGLTAFQDKLSPGNVFYGPIKDPVGNAFHRSESGAIFGRPEELCVNCHNVHYDSDRDGQIVKGPDLVLQSTSQEHDEYRAEGGQGTCLTCHMQVKPGQTSAADNAWLFVDQDSEPPRRVVHDHSFIGVDYPLDVPPGKDKNDPRREALLRSAARLEMTDPIAAGGSVSFSVSITNVGAGHNLPTGFAFARQMWIEVRGVEESGRVAFSSGVLADPTADLCDAGTVDEPGNPLRRFVQGCSAGDAQLVNIQGKLVDKRDVQRDAAGREVKDGKGEAVIIAAAGGRETVLQHLAAGVTARVRPSTGQKMVAITPNDTSTFAYRFTAPRGAGLTVSVRLLFRSLPPYFLRALAAGQPSGETPKLGPLIKNVRVVEMAKLTRRVR